MLLGSTAPLFAAPPPGSAMWLSNGNDWSSGFNWTGNSVPTVTAFFDTSTQTSLTFSANASVNNIVFNSDASAYTISPPGGITFTINGAGITNSSSFTQNFAPTVNSSGAGYIVFTNGASAGSSPNIAFTNAGGVTSGDFGAAEYFDGSSSAGNATFTNRPGTLNGASGGFVYFDNTSSASGATIVNNGAQFVGANGGTASFNASSSAGNATITNNAGTVPGAFGGYTIFANNSNGGNATIINNGATFAGNGVEGSYTWFQNSASAMNATLIANGGSNGGQGGEIAFYKSATGGTAKIILSGNGFLDISSLTAPTTSVTVGSLASGASGGGAVFLGAYNLAVGSDSTSTTFGGVIQDGGVGGGAGGSFTKVGAGTLTLTGASTYTGNTIVSGGSLIVDGSIASPVTTVNPGALLGGYGTIGGNLVNGGSVSPGNSPGTLTVKGNYTQGSSGALVIQIGGLAANQHDLLKVGGNASLGGTLQLQSLNGFKFAPGQEVTFLTSGGSVTGKFSTVQNLASFDGSVLATTTIIYLSNAVEIEESRGSIYGALNGQSGVTANDLQTAKLLDSAAGDPAAAKLFGVLKQANLSQLIKDLELIDPGSLAALSNIGSSISNQTLLSLTQRFEALQGLQITSGPAGPAGPDGKGGKEVMTPPAGNRWGSFITGSGDFERVEDTPASRGYNMGAGGVTLGVDYRFTDHLVVGIFGSYTNTGIDISNGRINVNTGKGGLYGTYFDGGFYVNSALEGGYSSYDNHRDSLGGTARSNTDGGDFNALFAPGYNWTMGGLTLGPTTRFQYSYQGTGGFTESGSLAPMSLGSQHTESIISGVGMKASYDWKVGSAIIRPELRLEWEHEYGDTATGIDAQLAGGAGSSLRFATPSIGRDDLHVGAGVGVVFNDRITAYAYYDGQFFRTNYDSSTVTGGFRVSF